MCSISFRKTARAGRTASTPLCARPLANKSFAHKFDCTRPAKNPLGLNSLKLFQLLAPARWTDFKGTIVIVTCYRQNPRRRSTMKKILIAGALILGTTSVSLAQGVYAAPGYGPVYYDYSPGYGSYNGGPRYGYS